VLIRNKRDRSVTIAPTDGTDPVEVEAGGTAEVDDHLGTSLLQQPDRWEPAGPTSVDTSIHGVLAQVGTSKNRARTALDMEQASEKPRATLVAALNKIIESEED
jgi:hypothetical protein